MTSPKRPWHRLPKETEKAFQAFDVYRAMGVDRTIQKAADEVGKSVATLNPWSRKHKWVKRAGAYDDHVTEEDLVRQKRSDLDQREKAREARVKAAMKTIVLASVHMTEAKAKSASFRDLAAAVKMAAEVLRREFEGETLTVNHDIKRGIEEVHNRREEIRLERLHAMRQIELLSDGAIEAEVVEDTTTREAEDDGE